MTVRSILFVSLLSPATLLAYSGGPPNGMTGAPGESNCTQCHGDFALNSGDGELVILAPAQFEAGETYDITVQLSDPDQSRWGFEFTPLDVGVTTITDATNTQSATSGANTYIKQTGSGTHSGTDDGPVEWTFQWTAPMDPPASVMFYASGNAANGNSGTSGDYIYTTSAESQFLDGVSQDATSLPTHIHVSTFPNPFNPTTRLDYTLALGQHVQLGIYNLRGSLVTQLVDEYREAGEHSAVFDAVDLPGGIYFYALRVQGSHSTGKLLLVK